MIERTQGIVQRNPVKTAATESLTRIFSEVVPVGVKNLEKARELLESGGKLVLMANHLSNADAPVIALALKNAGFDDLSRKLVFLLGMKLVDNKVIRLGIDAYSHIVVWPPTMVPMTGEERMRAMATTKSSLRATKGAHEAGGILVIFPEGTRSRQHKLAHGTAAIANYLEGERIYVVPVGISGTEKVLPIGSFFPTWGVVEVGFGEPLDHSQTLKGLTDVSRENRKQRIIDRYMIEIAKLLHPQYRGVYADGIITPSLLQSSQM